MTGTFISLKDQHYAWRVGDVFTDGTHRWAVDAVRGEKAILRSCGSSWATTILLTFSEWREGGRWRLEAQDARDRKVRKLGSVLDEPVNAVKS